MMPPEAFQPEPATLNAIPPLVRDIEQNNPTTPGASPVADSAGGSAIV